MIILGIDPGLSGGLALIESGERRRVLFCADIPIMGEGAKRRVNVVALLGILQKFQISHAFIERAQAMPDQGASSGFNYGRAVGAIEASVMGMQIPLTFVEASVWKREQGLIKTEKEDSRQRALLLYPESLPYLARKKDHNRAESVLIGDHGLTLLTKSPSSPGRKPAKKPAQLDLVEMVLDTKQGPA